MIEAIMNSSAMLNKLNKQYKPFFDFLNKWEDDSHLYDLVAFHSMEFYQLTEEPDILKEYFDADLSKYFDDRFISFAVDGGGGTTHFGYIQI